MIPSGSVVDQHSKRPSLLNFSNLLSSARFVMDNIPPTRRGPGHEPVGNSFVMLSETTFTDDFDFRMIGTDVRSVVKSEKGRRH